MNSSGSVYDECGYNTRNPSDKYVMSQVFVCVVYILLSTPTVLLNGVSIFTILKCSQLNEKVNYFAILMQSVVDLFVGVITLPVMAASVLLKDLIHVRNTVLCSLALNLGFFPVLLSIWSLCVLSFERYMGVVHPFVHRTKVTKKRIFIFECSVGLLTLVYTLITPTNPSGMLIMIVFFVIFFVPLLLIVYCYTKIFTVARKSLAFDNKPRRVVGAAQVEMSAKMKKKKHFLKELKLAKSCFLVTCMFGLCFLPFILLSLMLDFLKKETRAMLFSWAMAIGALNSSINSLIFFWSRTMMRKEAIKVLKICCS